ncbi:MULTISPECIES: Flp pilus assembly protein CpaB [unclassified Phenylobacterium]|uniref:Flp pilus assembly protein CpaB n=1 Tax=unclassified Phenylobacterium TaxID=2640670 RepID=UPI0022B58EF0|nr:Flp pilus assembly protein CpaB [Phenylobacterium sp. NIBR 498073]WGU39908.1 Flp pilus assembly protein CpaB [Phenylobacterium sp. NIBR 498073]
MGPARIALLAVAAIAAIGLAFIVRGMVTPQRPEALAAAPPPQPVVQVLVAKRELPIGTRLTPADLGWQPWPANALNAAFVTDGAAPALPAKMPDKAVQKAARAANDLVMPQGPIQAFEGAIVKEALAAGEPVVARKVVRAGQSGFMAVVLAPGMRAMAIPINAETAAGGFILPGDRVDVLQSRQDSSGGAKAMLTEVLMRNVRVLAIDQNIEPAKDSRTIVGGVATIEVPAADVEVIARGKAQGEMQLALRSYADIGGPPGRGVASRASAQGVRVFRAGQVTEVANP